MRSFGHPTPAPPQLGRGGAHPAGHIYGRLLLAAATAVALACGRGRENAVIPGRFDLAQKSRAVLPGKTYESRGQIVSGRWTYLDADGKIVIQLRDGIVTEVETTFY